MTRCPQRTHASRWPPSAAVRQRSMAVNTFKWSRFSQERLRSMKARPALRTRSATSRGGGGTYLPLGGLPANVT